MASVTRFLPGIIGAVAAYTVARVLRLIAPQSLTLELGVFLLTYIVLTVIVHRAFKAYGRGD